MRSPFVVAPLGNLRHNYGVDRGTYVHRALDVFVPPDDPRWTQGGVPGRLLAPGDGHLSDYHDVDSGAGGFWVKFVEDNGTHWYFAHNAHPPGYARGTHLTAGTELTITGWTGNAGPGNVSGPGRRTEAHVHAEAKVPIGGGRFAYADPWLALCAMWGLDPRPYKHDGIAMPFVVLQADVPLTPDVGAAPPSNVVTGDRAFTGRIGRDPGRQARNVLQRVWDFVRGGIVLPSEMEEP